MVNEELVLKYLNGVIDLYDKHIKSGEDLCLCEDSKHIIVTIKNLIEKEK
jgi:hypothetical protein